MPALAGAGVAAGAVATTASGTPMLAFGRARREAEEASVTDYKGLFLEFGVPIALIIGGIIAWYIDAGMRGLHDPLTMTAYVFLTCTINLVLVVSAVLVAVRMLDLGLGKLGPAILKIVAVALLPNAMGDMIATYTMGVFSWGATLILYYCLLAYLFDLDGAWIVAAIIWIIQTWVSLLILGLLFGAMGILSHTTNNHGVATTVTANTPRMSTPLFVVTGGGDTPAGPQAPPPDPDAGIKREIADGTAVEFTKWGKVGSHGLTQMAIAPAIDEANRFYAAGAKKVWAASIDHPENEYQICHQMVVELPDSPAAKKAVKNVIGGLDEPYHGHGPNATDHYIYIPLD